LNDLIVAIAGRAFDPHEFDGELRHRPSFPRQSESRIIRTLGAGMETAGNMISNWHGDPGRSFYLKDAHSWAPLKLTHYQLAGRLPFPEITR